MPRSYFDMSNDLSVDGEEGMDLPDVNAARLQAEKYAIEMAGAEVLEHRKLNAHHPIEVTDENGELVHTVEFETWCGSSYRSALQAFASLV
jgi:hypothetical protein